MKVPFILLLSLCCLGAFAQSKQTAEQVTMKDGRPQIQKEGALIPLEEELELSESIKVHTNGTFTVEGSKPRALSNGQVLKKDGYLVNPDGTMAPVFDRITVEKTGSIMITTTVMIHQGGQESRLTTPYTLPDGSRVMPDGTLILRNGTQKRLIPGQMFKLSGGVLESKDSVTMNNGTVYVQKEGQRYKIEPNRTFFMNDGTKVFGSGKIVEANGTERLIEEGDIITVPGVRVK